ncbi:hypothetical protein LTR66_016073, partial [Elasticomyces elasticus]
MPPILTSMFTVTNVSTQVAIVVQGPMPLVSSSLKPARITYQFQHEAYAYTWLGQELPAFTSNSSAFAPLALPTQVSYVQGDTITASTVRYWTELDCWPITSATIDDKTAHIILGDNKGNIDTYAISRGFNQSNTAAAKFETYYEAADSSSSHVFMSTWAVLDPYAPDFMPGGNGSAAFCEAIYYQESVKLTIIAESGKVVSYRPTGDQQALSLEHFNMTHFERILGVWQYGGFFDSFPGDIIDTSRVQQYSKLMQYNVVAPNSSIMAGYAVGLTGWNATDFFDIDKMRSAYNLAHQLNLAYALRYAFDNTSQTDTMQILESHQQAIRLVPAFVIGSEVLLGVIACLCISMLLIGRHRTLWLRRDPDSLAEVVVLARERSIQDVFGSLEFVIEKDAELLVAGDHYKLNRACGGAPYLTRKARAYGLINSLVDKTESVSQSVSKLRHPAEISAKTLFIAIS